VRLKTGQTAKIHTTRIYKFHSNVKQNLTILRKNAKFAQKRQIAQEMIVVIA